MTYNNTADNNKKKASVVLIIFYFNFVLVSMNWTSAPEENMEMEPEHVFCNFNPQTELVPNQ